MDSGKLNAKKDEFIEKYFECINKAAEDFKAGKNIDVNALQALNDAIRIFNHLLGMQKPLEK